jgi:DNA-binding MarR family transcriptional regulator
MIVLPYLGTAAARRELERPAAKPALRARAPISLLPPGMRLTYRTVRVLGAVATNPGASNRAIGDEAGVDDQGQISKLLGRLEKLELIENSSARLGRGEPNAWVLTQRGEEVSGALTARARV